MEPFSVFPLHELDHYSPLTIPTSNTTMCALNPQDQHNTLINNTSWFIPDQIHQLKWPNLDNNVNALMMSNVADYKNNVTMDPYHSCSSSSSSSIIITPSPHKRKPPQGPSLSCPHLSKGKRQRKMRNCEEKRNKLGHEGYIYVRAKRGEATDRHSLAERVRRERIRERMKLLQALVPGCDKVTGKAIMLDEIISYVKSLQNQVEFLSSQLASVNPILFGPGTDLKPCPEFDNQSSNSLLRSLTAANNSSYPQFLDNDYTLQQQPQIPNDDMIIQGFWELVDEQRQEIINIQTGSNDNTLFSFH